MKLRNLLMLVFLIFSIHVLGVKHSDEEMRAKIKESEVSFKDVPRDNLIFKQRCSSSDKNTSDDIKLAKIDQGYKYDLYTETIRDELRAARLFPFIQVNMDNSFSVYYLCPFE